MNRKILNLAIPNIISNLSVPLLGAVDTALVGHLDEVYYLGAIALGSMIFNFLFWGFGFLRMGTTGLTAQAFGEKDRQESILILARALAVAAIFSTLIILLQTWIADLSFWLVEGSPEVERYTKIYFDIRIYSAPATLGLYAINGWFLGMQNARYPMIVTIFLNALNIGLDFLFVYGMGMHVDGVATGTLIARYAGVTLAVALLIWKYRDWLSAYMHDRLMELASIKKFFSVNRDIFLRTLCLIFTFSFFTAKSAEFGDVILAANSILLQLWMVVSYGIDGFAYAAESLIGRYTGAKQNDRVKLAVKYCFAWGIGIGVIASGVYWLFDSSILNLFTDQQNVINTAMTVFLWTVAGPTVSSFCYIWDGVFIGATATEPMRDSMLIATLLIFLPAFYLGVGHLGNHAIWLAMVLFMIARGVTLSLYAPRYILK
ncbi:MATE family efflux transporter [Aliifodinibius sp. S!AR15-10]|uniref:MATE family efflux transporter n=1 Tax=Aliifodinibius sp. S!AR15-10 TaxID=2950437 RepID=UPI002856103E|nr:MATE family efflux transporter [Aliifodinibius sp. S!AR15-10]MDR8394176.1 MATE family efflux transporter [Aliifodinibius sp. S!AR15-10]